MSFGSVVLENLLGNFCLGASPGSVAQGASTGSDMVLLIRTCYRRGNMAAAAGEYGGASGGIWKQLRGNVAAAAGIMCSDDQADRAIEILEGLRGQGGVERHLGDIYSEQGDYKR